MKQGILSLIIVFAWGEATGQIESQQNIPLKKQEQELRQFSDSITRGSSDQVRQAALAAFNPLFLDLLNDPATFNYPFDSLTTISKIKSPDGNLRIFTWILPSRAEGTYTHFGIIQRKNPVNKKLKTIGLMEVKRPNEEAQQSELKADTWYGAVYYDLIEKKVKKKTFYYLLGWHGNDRLTTRKVIDVVHFDQWDNLTFGHPVFIDEKKKKNYRLIFEYNAQAVMLLRYEKNMIVFDHLSPSSPSARGQYRYYGPDFTYDGLKYKKGFWHYKTNLDLRNKRE